MTLRTLYTVDCDGRADGTRHPKCREWVGSIGTEEQVRWGFGRNGWRQDGPLDRCPECAEGEPPERGLRSFTTA